MDLIKQYKDILNEKRNDYYQYLFLLLLFTVLPMLQVVNQLKLFIGVFLYHQKSSKKFECKKNELIPDENIYKVKLDEKIIMKNLQIFSSGGKENGFVFDCTNKQKSTMKD